MVKYDFLVIGGGAAGYFAAINVKEKSPHLRVGIVEKQGKVLQKVKVSGGGRCNVTNSETRPDLLAENYPRGREFLAKAFQRFGSQQTSDWFTRHGVHLKTEKDGRVFPKSDSSQTIIDCFQRLSKGIDLHLRCRVENIAPTQEGWTVTCSDGQVFETRKLMIATGSDARIWHILQELGLSISPQVPSLFTFNIEDKALQELQGISFPRAEVKVKNLAQQGPLLITHWGLSGPAVLKLSAWGAYSLKEVNYEFDVTVNWTGKTDKKEVEEQLKYTFVQNPKKNIRLLPFSDLTQRFWNYICNKSGIAEFQKGAETGKKQIANLLENLTSSRYRVSGKSTFKEEFVTAGGVNLNEIHVERFACINYPHLYLGGEVLDIDAITGGFNFQAAWTAGWIISEDVEQSLS
jgi:predicted Rossmann fold flavoprotein